VVHQQILSFLAQDSDDSSPPKFETESRGQRPALSDRVASTRSTRNEAVASPKKVTSTDDEPQKTLQATPDTARMTAIWETKLEETKTPVTSTPRSDISSIRNKGLGEARLNFETPKSTESQRETENKIEDREVDNGNGSKLGSMLSMWESKKAGAVSAFNAAEDEAFDKSTMGRLQGAKALFENMSKSEGNGDSQTSSVLRTSPHHTSKAGVNGAKSLFENMAKSPATSSPKRSTPIVVKKSPSVVKAQPVKEASDSDLSDFGSDLSDAETLSSTSSSDDEDEYEVREGQVNDVKKMWERRSSESSQKT